MGVVGNNFFLRVPLQQNIHLTLSPITTLLAFVTGAVEYLSELDSSITNLSLVGYAVQNTYIQGCVNESRPSRFLRTGAAPQSHRPLLGLSRLRDSEYPGVVYLADKKSMPLHGTAQNTTLLPQQLPKPARPPLRTIGTTNYASRSICTMTMTNLQCTSLGQNCYTCMQLPRPLRRLCS